MKWVQYLLFFSLSGCYGLNEPLQVKIVATPMGECKIPENYLLIPQQEVEDLLTEMERLRNENNLLNKWKAKMFF